MVGAPRGSPSTAAGGLGSREEPLQQLPSCTEKSILMQFTGFLSRRAPAEKCPVPG